MHGNRDLLIGQEFARRCGARLHPDPKLLDLYGTRTLAMHGDTLCTDDTEYQKFRAYARNPDNQARFLAQPLEARKQQMLGMRAQSEQDKQTKSEEIMDVTPAAVEQVLREHGYPRLIHGHTHRPARHLHVVDGHDCERWVLNDWYQRGGYLRCDASGLPAPESVNDDNARYFAHCHQLCAAGGALPSCFSICAGGAMRAFSPRCWRFQNDGLPGSVSWR